MNQKLLERDRYIKHVVTIHKKNSVKSTKQEKKNFKPMKQNSNKNFTWAYKKKFLSSSAACIRHKICAIGVYVRVCAPFSEWCTWTGGRFFSSVSFLFILLYCCCCCCSRLSAQNILYCGFAAFAKRREKTKNLKPINKMRKNELKNMFAPMKYGEKTLTKLKRALEMIKDYSKWISA